jgi:hypothetical protein
LRSFHNRGKREKIFTTRQRVIRVTTDYSWSQISAVVPDRESIAVTVRGGDVSGARFEEPLIDHRVDTRRDLRVREGREFSFRIVGCAWNDARQLFCERFADLIGVSRNPNRGRVHTRTPAVLSYRSNDHVEILFPIVDTVFADEDLAITGAVNLDTRIVGPNARRRAVAKQQRAAAVSQDLARAAVIGRIKTKSFRRI